MNTNKHGYAVASLVLGILSIVFCCCWYLGLILGVVGLVLAIVAKKNGNDEGICKAGLVLCIIGTALGAVFMIFAIIGTKAISYEELMRQIGIPQLNGVVKDFLGRIQGDGIRAIEITETGPFDRIIVKTLGDHSECRSSIMETYKKMSIQMLGYCPEPRESGYIPDVVQKKVNESIEGSLLRLLFFFSILPLILTLSGVMAMSTFYVTSHRRDISIRKIFGGSIGQETRTYLWRFLRIMFIGNLVGIPLAFWINSRIYLGIPMSVGGSIWIYLLTFAITMLMAFICVFPQVFQAAKTNPAVELKKE